MERTRIVLVVAAVLACDVGSAHATMCNEVPLRAEDACGDLDAQLAACTSDPIFAKLDCVQLGQYNCTAATAACQRAPVTACEETTDACFKRVDLLCKASLIDHAHMTLRFRDAAVLGALNECRRGVSRRYSECAAQFQACTSAPSCPPTSNGWPTWPRGTPGAFTCSSGDAVQAAAGRFHAGSAKSDVFYYQPGKRKAWVVSHNGETTRCWSGDFYGYDFASAQDRVAVLDFDGDGVDDLMAYRRGMGAVYLFRGTGNGDFTLVQGGLGIAGYDLRGNDQVLPFDFNADGKKDLVIYRPGAGKFAILRANGTSVPSWFTSVASSESTGMGGFDLRDTRDRIVTLDVDGNRKQDLLFYRPGAGLAALMRSNGNGSFSRVLNSSTGIATYDLRSSSDIILPIDLNGDHYDDVLLYRPIRSIMYIALSNRVNGFDLVGAWSGVSPDFDLSHWGDRILPFDFDGNGYTDLLFYRTEGKRLVVWQARTDAVGFTTKLRVTTGMEGFDKGFTDPLDQALILDANGDAKQDFMLFRPAQGMGRVYLSNGEGSRFSYGPCDTSCSDVCLL